MKMAIYGCTEICMYTQTHQLNYQNTDTEDTVSCLFMVVIKVIKVAVYEAKKLQCYVSSSLLQLRKGPEVDEPQLRTLSMTFCNENGKVCGAVWLWKQTIGSAGDHSLCRTD